MVFPDDTDCYFEITDAGLKLLDMTQEPDDLGFYHYEAAFMQYTGLKDMNGVEIYEGDIIDAGFLMDELLLTDSGVVVFKEYRFIVEHPDYGEEDLVDWTIGESLEVIGNIYENKNLLRRTQDEQRESIGIDNFRNNT